MPQSRITKSPYGFLYDNSYQLCSQTDYKKSLKKAIKFSDFKKKMPIFENMYSDVCKYPRCKTEIKSSNIIPPSFIKDYASSLKKINSYLLRYAGMGCNTDYLKILIPEMFKKKVVPIGIDRYTYFTKPIIPKSIVLQPDVTLISMKMKRAYYLKQMEKMSILTRTVSTQTIYRDSTTQTEPYSPDFVLRPGAEPEVLSLIPLSYGNGLPVGMHEINVIERSRHRKEIENHYSKLKDLGNIRQRRAEINKLEIEEWHIRESQIDELQLARLDVTMKLMGERKENLETMRREKMNQTYIETADLKDEKLKVVRFEYVKAIRKLLKLREHVTTDKEDKSIINKYNNPMSQVWAPLTRIGQFIDRSSERYVVDNKYLTTYNGLNDLDDGLPSFVKNPNIKIPKLEMYTKDGYKKKRYRFEDELKELYKHIKSKDEILNEKRKRQLRFLKKIETPPARSLTQLMDFDECIDEEYELAIMLLQQMIKGRAIQIMIYEGKEKRIELIKELRSTHAIQKEEIKVKKQEKKVILALQKNRLLFEHKESTLNDYLGNLKGQSSGDMFDFLSKELIRLQEERRIHAFIMLCERERRMREAEESGLRQVEERRRREEDDMFKQIVKVEQTTVQSYLQYLITDNVNWQAEEEARRDIEILAKNINDQAYEMELKRDYLKTEEIVSDLVHHFLIPEVYKIKNREKIALNQRLFLLAAHKVILKSTDDAVHETSVQSYEDKLKLDASTEIEEVNNENTDEDQEIA